MTQIAVLNADDAPGLWVHQRETLNGHAARLGVQFELFSLRDYKHAASLSRTLRARGYEGIVLDRMMLAVSLEGIRWEHFSVACCGRYLQDLPFDTVRESEGAKLRRVLRRLHATGHRRIGVMLFCHKPKIEDDFDREAEIHLHHQTIPAEERIEPYIEEGANSNHAQLLAWYGRYRPDAIIGFHSHYYHVIHNEGPRDQPPFAFASLHVWPYEVDEGLISGFRSSELAVAEKSLEHVSNLVRHNRRGIPTERTEIIVQAPWVTGTTLISEFGAYTGRV